MSITIGPAYKLAAGTDVLKFADQLRATVIPAVEQFFFQHIYENSVLIYDDAQEYKPIEGIIKEELKESCYCDDKDRDWYTRLSLTLTGYIFHNRVRDELYLMIPNLPNTLTHLVEALPEVEGDYSYYNGSDAQLSEMTQEEWDDRLVAWEETLQPRVPFGKQGVSIALNMERYRMAYEEYKQYLPLLDTVSEKRRQRRILTGLYCRQVTPQMPDKDEALQFVITVISDRDAVPLYAEDRFQQEWEKAQKDFPGIWAERKACV